MGSEVLFFPRFQEFHTDTHFKKLVSESLELIHFAWQGKVSPTISVLCQTELACTEFSASFQRTTGWFVLKGA